jgi:hypothetical protein
VLLTVTDNAGKSSQDITTATITDFPPTPTPEDDVEVTLAEDLEEFTDAAHE